LKERKFDSMNNADMSSSAETSAKWKSSVKSSLNRLSNQYLTLLRAASSEVALTAVEEEEEANQFEQSASATSSSANIHGSNNLNIIDPRIGGGRMIHPNEPPPPLASSTSLSELTTLVASENICTTVNELLDLIRIARLSVLVMGEDRAEEEAAECWEDSVVMEEVLAETQKMEQKLLKLREKDCS